MDSLGNLCVGGKVICKWLVKKFGVRAWTGFFWLRIGPSSGFLRTMSFEFHKRRVIYWLAELFAPQKWLCCIHLLSTVLIYSTEYCIYCIIFVSDENSVVVHAVTSYWPEAMRCSTAIALQFYLRICHQEISRKSSQFGIEWDTSAIGLCWWC